MVIVLIFYIMVFYIGLPSAHSNFVHRPAVIVEQEHEASLRARTSKIIFESLLVPPYCDYLVPCLYIIYVCSIIRYMSSHYFR